MRASIAGSYILMILTVGPVTAGAAVQFTDVFVGGAEGPNGTAYFRIPALAVAPNGDLMAFAEARREPNDPGEVPGQFNYLVSKRLVNGETNWSPLQVFVSSSQFSYDEPRAMVDASSGKLFVLYTQWPDAVPFGQMPVGQGSDSTVTFYRSSADNGQTWSVPVNINYQVKEPTWAELAVTAGAGIQLRWQSDPARNGRLIHTPFVIAKAPPFTMADIRDVSIYSDDHGVTWTHGSIAASTKTADEAQIVELSNGDVLMDARSTSTNSNYRTRWISHDGGATWGNEYAGDIPVTTTNTGLIRYSAKRDGNDRDRILYCAPLGVNMGHAQVDAADQCNLGIWTSYDEGKTFINPVQIDSGFAQYSAIQKLPGGSIGVLYEKTATTLLRLARFGLADLEGQSFSSHLTHYDGFGNNIDRNRGGIGWSGSWTGTGAATNAYSAQLGGNGLHFAGASLPAQDGRMDLTPGHNNAERQLATPINLNTSATAYVSLLVSQALDTSGNLSNKPLTVDLRDAGEVSRVSFGVGSQENFFIDKLGGAYSTGSGAVDGSAMYMLLLKIVSQDSTPGNHDQIFLKTFRSGVDAIPVTDAGLAWTLVGSTGANSSALIDRIALYDASAATWSFDELRIGDTYGAVAGIMTPEPGSMLLLATGLLGLLAYAWRKRR